MNTTAKIAIPVAAMTALISLGGCAWGNSPRIQQPTLGQQMIDLKRSLDDGAITEKEYERSKADFLNGTNQ